MTKDRNTGSSFDAFLEEEGVREEVEAVAIKRVIAWEIKQATMTGYFGQFGSMEYQPKDIELLADHAARVPCRWCVGEGDPEMDCPCCKNTRRMWIGIA